jgi:ABC-type Fe3+-siderophore transport system permease subunit
MTNYRRVIRLCHRLSLPEWNVGMFSFLLNFFWEIQQMPFYQIPAELSHSDITRNCTIATVGDVGISIAAFWAVAVISKSRQWFHQPSRWQVSSFILVGVVITVVFEALATRVFHTWQYAELMPILPFLGTGLLPLLQWTLIPPIILWFVKRQLSDCKRKSSSQPLM